MRSLTYVSSARRLWTEPELTGLLVAARAWNRPRALTGMLLYSGGNFAQSVEGEHDMVAEVFERINADSRHGGLLVMLDEQVEARSFPEWTMGFRRVTTADLDVEGHTEFLRDPSGAAGVGDTASVQMSLLHSFRSVTR